MKQVIVANNLFMPLARGGAEQAVAKQLIGFADLGYETSLISTKPRWVNVVETTNWHIRRVSSAYYNLATLPKSCRLLWHLWHLLVSSESVKALTQIKKEAQDMVVTNNLMGLGFRLGAQAKSQKLTWVHVVHDIQLLHPSGLINYGQEGLLNTWSAKLYQRLVKQQFGEPDLVVSPSAWLLDMHQRCGFFQGSSVVVLANPELPETREGKVAHEGFCFGYLGQIEEHKGISLLVEAFKNLQTKELKRKDFKLKIVGSGQLSKQIQQYSQDLRIDCLGQLTRVEVKKFLQLIDCLVVPSLCYENAPTVIVEAVRQGVPVIASDLGGIRELIRDDQYRFKPELQDLTEKLAWVLDNADYLEVPQVAELISPTEYCKRIVTTINKEQKARNK